MIVVHALTIVLNVVGLFLLSAVLAVESANRDTSADVEILIPAANITPDDAGGEQQLRPNATTGDFAPQCARMQPSKATLGPERPEPRWSRAEQSRAEQLLLSHGNDGNFSTAMQTRSSWSVEVAVNMNSEAQYVTLMEITDDLRKFYWICNEHHNHLTHDTTTHWTCPIQLTGNGS
eukprot:g516.t1